MQAELYLDSTMGQVCFYQGTLENYFFGKKFQAFPDRQVPDS